MDEETATSDQDFEAAFAEFSGAPSGGETPADAEPEARVDPPSGDQPSERAEPEPDAKKADPDSDVKKTPEEELAEARAQIADLQHRERSASGRVGEFQRQINQANAQIQELTRRIQSAAPAAAASDAPADADDPELADLLKEMPELGQMVDRLVAKKVAKTVEVIQSRVQQVEEGVLPLRQKAEQDQAERERQAVREQLAVVEKEFPDWRETVFSKPFETWIDGKPASIREAYKHAGTAADCLEFLRMYRRENAATSTTHHQADPDADPSAHAASKQQRLERSVGLPSRAAGKPAGGMPAKDDFEGAFAHFSSRKA